MTENLPVPVTREELFLAAILAELRAIRRKLGRNGPQRPALAEDEAIEVELQETEPVRAPRRRGKE